MSQIDPPRLGVNLDHLVTIRQARHTPYPDLMEAIKVSEDAGAEGITMHLREDRRHIQDADVYAARRQARSTLNLEMAATDEMVAIALDLRPDFCCLVPERRAELTTEGGLDVHRQRGQLNRVCGELRAAHIPVSLFIEPDPATIDVTAAIGVPMVELHTGRYADPASDSRRDLEQIERCARHATSLGIQVNAGHGLHYDNVAAIAAIDTIAELNIGHAIIARALFTGLAAAVRDMKQAMRGAA